MKTQYCLLLWDGDSLYGVFGPYDDAPSAINADISSEGEGLRRTVVVLFAPL